MMNGARWRWLVEQTGEDTIRGVAEACGVTHTTIRRWLSGGIPMASLTELMFRLNADPIDAVVAWGYLRPELVDQLNWEAFVQYVPFEVLRDEIHRRELAYGSEWEDRLRRHVPPPPPLAGVV